MTVPDVTAPIFNPHGGPITHNSTGSKPDSPIHPCFLSYSSRLASYERSRPTFLVIYYGIRRNTYSHCSEPLSPSVSGNERLPNRLELLVAPPYLALDNFLEFQLERCLYATFTEIAPRYLTYVELRPSRVSPLSFP